jgi:hypothetical protein
MIQLAKEACKNKTRLTHRQKLAVEFDQYICDNYRRNIIMQKDNINSSQIKEQIFILYQLLGGSVGYYTFDKMNEDGSYDIKYEYLAELIKYNLDIEIRRKPGERINVKEYTKDHFIE